MPRYEYECEKCKDIRTISSTGYNPIQYYTVRCRCGGKYKIKQSTPAVIFKGGGWSKSGYSKSGKIGVKRNKP
jgi:predicted nucleic acid-binding Zn ribbon protein